MEQPRFYGEYRKQLKAAQISLRLDGPQRSRVQDFKEERREFLDGKYNLVIKTNCIQLSFGDASPAWTYILPRGIRALPETCSGLEWVQNEGIQMRIQLKTREDEDDDDDNDDDGDGDDVFEGEKRDEDLVDGDEDLVDGDEETGDPFLRALEHPGCEVICARCGAVLLLPPGGFTRVLPLPSGDWGDLAGDMWCCKSKIIAQERGKMTPLQLTPEEGSVMVGDLHFMVNSRTLEKGSVRIEKRKSKQQNPSPFQMVKSHSVSCQRCGCVVGSIDNQGGSSQLETTKLYRYAVIVTHRKMTENSMWSSPLEYTISRLMVALFKNQMTFKYIVEEEEEHRPQLLIWLLGIDTSLLHARTPSCGQSLPGQSRSPSAAASAAPTPGEGGDLEVRLESHRIIKVLYQTCECEGGQKLAKDWNRDLMVHGITLTNEACLELGLLLATSTTRAPPAMRQMNGYMVGSLKLDQG